MDLESSTKRVLVTGGAGFLGSHLCERLLAQGNDVLCVDNLYTGSRDNVLSLIGHPRFELMRHDVTFPLYVEVDEIYNLACPASPVHYQFDPVQTTKTSVHGAINMLGLAKRVKAKILQASTSEVYGDPQIHPQPESYWGHVNPIGIRFQADFWFPKLKLALEVDGGVWMNKSGHTSGTGYTSDRERDVEALLQGIITVRYTSDQVRSGYAIKTFQQIFTARAQEMGASDP